MKELTIEATPENVDKGIEFVDEMLEEYSCGMKEQMAIDVAVDELFANIAHYAYNPETGYATVKVEVVEDPLSVEITFVDNGKPYDPLAKADPDTTQSIEDREIGGMGISVPAFAAEKEIFIKKYYPFSGEVHLNKYKTKSLRVERSQYENS